MSPIPDPRDTIPEHDETDDDVDDDDEVPDNHAHHAAAVVLHHNNQQHSNNSNNHRHHNSPAHSNYSNHRGGGVGKGGNISAAMEKYREESDSGDSGEGELLKDDQESNSDSEAEVEEVNTFFCEDSYIKINKHLL